MADVLRAFLRCSVGRRGAFLLTHGVLFIAYGYEVATTVADRPEAQQALYTLVEMVMPLRWWGLLWVATGILASASAISWHWHRLRSMAFSGLMGLSTVWAIGLGAAELAPGVSGTSSWIAGTVFMSLMAGIAVVAGWPEPSK